MYAYVKCVCVANIAACARRYVCRHGKLLLFAKWWTSSSKCHSVEDSTSDINPSMRMAVCVCVRWKASTVGPRCRCRRHNGSKDQNTVDVSWHCIYTPSPLAVSCYISLAPKNPNTQRIRWQRRWQYTIESKSTSIRHTTKENIFTSHLLASLHNSSCACSHSDNLLRLFFGLSNYIDGSIYKFYRYDVQLKMDKSNKFTVIPIIGISVKKILRSTSYFGISFFPSYSCKYYS